MYYFIRLSTLMRNDEIFRSLFYLKVEQLTTELSVERSTTQKLETEKQAMERANRELKNKVSELETSAQTRSRAQIAALEAKIQYLEEQYNAESQERANATRQVSISFVIFI